MRIKTQWMPCCLLALLLLIPLASAADDAEQDLSPDALLQKIGQGFALAQQAAKRRDYAQAIDQLRQWRSDAVDSVDPQQHQQLIWALNQPLVTLLSWVGDYQGAMSYPIHAANQDKADLDGLRPGEAVEAIAKAASGRRIVMLNEAHHIPKHRVLAKRLLEPLYQRGFRYLAVEALSEAHQAQQHGYALAAGGGYINEPVFGELIRQAQAMGYTLIDYDRGEGDQREVVAARNIIQESFALDDQARVLVFAGYAHINKRDGWLAEHLATQLGFEPLSISQTKHREAATPDDESPVYRHFADEIIPAAATQSPQLHSEPAVLLDADGSVWSASPDDYDMSVFWPRTRYQQQRPGWQLNGHELLVFQAAWCQQRYPCLLEVVRADAPLAVAFDRLLLQSAPSDRVALRVPPEAYVIRAFDRLGQSIATHSMDAAAD